MDLVEKLATQLDRMTARSTDRVTEIGMVLLARMMAMTKGEQSATMRALQKELTCVQSRELGSV